MNRRFEDLVSPGAGRIAGQLDEASLLIAAILDPPVVIEEQISILDDLADRSAASSLSELLAFLFGPGGFSGDRRTYYDPQNSLLHRVLARRLGIPITLAVVTIEVGRRCDLSVGGVGMPGHFLAHHDGVFIDVFGGGVLLDVEGCRKLAATVAGRPVVLPDGALDVTPPGDILRRMLLNLRLIAERKTDAKLLRSVLTLLTAFPEVRATDLLLLARTHAASGRFDLAASAGERAVELIAPQRQEALRSQIEGWRARLN